MSKILIIVPKSMLDKRTREKKNTSLVFRIKRSHVRMQRSLVFYSNPKTCVTYSLLVSLVGRVLIGLILPVTVSHNHR
ncbi:hypothetical protein Hanom_Chr02g00105511 [Helianthus anomalus]